MRKTITTTVTSIEELAGNISADLKKVKDPDDLRTAEVAQRLERIRKAMEKTGAILGELVNEQHDLFAGNGQAEEPTGRGRQRQRKEPA